MIGAILEAVLGNGEYRLLLCLYNQYPSKNNTNKPPNTDTIATHHNDAFSSVSVFCMDVVSVFGIDVVVAVVSVLGIDVVVAVVSVFGMDVVVVVVSVFGTTA